MKIIFLDRFSLLFSFGGVFVPAQESVFFIVFLKDLFEWKSSFWIGCNYYSLLDESSDKIAPSQYIVLAAKGLMWAIYLFWLL